MKNSRLFLWESRMQKNASLLKRLFALVYDFLILIALWLFVTWLFLLLFGHVETALNRLLLQLLLWIIAGVYFVFSWYLSGHTLALQAWKIQLVDKDNNLLGRRLAIKRYLLASFSLLFLSTI